MKASDLVGLDLDAACKAKWEAGRKKYGADWQGEHPLLEGLSDAVDVVVYLRRAWELGTPGLTRNLLNEAEWLARAMQFACLGASRASGD